MLRKILQQIPLLPLLMAVVGCVVLADYLIPEKCIEVPLNTDYTWRGVAERVRQTDRGQRVTLTLLGAGRDTTQLDNCRELKVMMTLRGVEKELCQGDVVTFGGRMRSLYEHVLLPDEMDYGAALRKQGYDLRCSVIADEVYGVEHSASLLSLCGNARSWLSDLIEGSDLGYDAKAFLLATIPGDSSWLPDEARQAFSAAGLAHLLALSGLHVGIVALIVGLLFYPLQMVGYPRLRTWCMIAVLWVYAAVTGMSPSVTRAVIMATMWMLAAMLERRYSPLNTLCAAAIVCLTYDPWQLFNAGFQLSFMAVLGILLLSRVLNPVSPQHWIAYQCVGAIAVSVSAMLGSGIVAVWHFHTFPVYFILANAAAALLLTPLVGGGMLLMLLVWMGFDAVWLCRVIDLLHWSLMSMGEWIGSLPTAQLTDIYFPWWLLIPYMAMIGCVMLWWHSRKRSHLIVAGVGLTAFVALAGVMLRSEEAGGDELYIRGGVSGVEMIMAHGDGLYWGLVGEDMSHRPSLASDTNIEFLRKNLSEYMSRRGLLTIEHIGGVEGSALRHMADGVILYDTTVVAYVGRKKPLLPEGVERTHYLILGTSVLNIDLLAAEFCPDTLLIASTLTAEGRRRVEETCAELGLPYYSLDDRYLRLSSLSSR